MYLSRILSWKSIRFLAFIKRNDHSWNNQECVHSKYDRFWKLKASWIYSLALKETG